MKIQSLNESFDRHFDTLMEDTDKKEKEPSIDDINEFVNDYAEELHKDNEDKEVLTEKERVFCDPKDDNFKRVGDDGKLVKSESGEVIKYPTEAEADEAAKEADDDKQKNECISNAKKRPRRKIESRKLARHKRVVESADNESKDYTVYINWGGYVVGQEQEYSEYADSIEEAVEFALNDASDDLEVEDIEEVDDGEYRVTVNFAGFIGYETEYEVYADNEEEAEEQALADARDDFEIARIEDEDGNCWDGNGNEILDEDVKKPTTVSHWRNKINPHKYMEVHNDNYGHKSFRQYMQWKNGEELDFGDKYPKVIQKGDVKNFTGDGRLHRMRKPYFTDIVEDQYYELTEARKRKLAHKKAIYEAVKSRKAQSKHLTECRIKPTRKINRLRRK